MKRGKYSKSAARKPIALVLALVLVLGAAIGGTIAWLTDSTNTVTNTFTTSDINIELTESANLDLQMIPGHTITKDPKVTVDPTSEDCYLYVKVEKSQNFDTYMTYTMGDGWIQLKDDSNVDVANVYYRVVNKTDDNKSFDVIKDNKVAVKSDVTKEKMQEAKDNLPTLTITAYATQKVNTNAADETIWSAYIAWADTFGKS